MAMITNLISDPLSSLLSLVPIPTSTLDPVLTPKALPDSRKLTLYGRFLLGPAAQEVIFLIRGGAQLQNLRTDSLIFLGYGRATGPGIAYIDRDGSREGEGESWIADRSGN